MAAPVCRTCIWWMSDPPSALEKRLGPQFGECRRNAPRLQLSRHTDDCSSVWPPTSADDWCGEHRPDLQATLPMERSYA